MYNEIRVTQTAMAQDKAIDKAVRMATAELGYASLKDKQIQVVTEFTSGRDVFAALPTGYGKSLCYGCLPRVFDKLRSIKLYHGGCLTFVSSDERSSGIF